MVAATHPENIHHDAFQELRERRAQSRDSIWILSREAWTAWLLSVVKHEFSETGVNHYSENLLRYKEARSDPWDEVISLDHHIMEARKDREWMLQTKFPSFDSGIHILPGQKFFGSAATFPDNEIMWLSEIVGIPLHLGQTSILASRFADATLCSFEDEKIRLRSLVRCVANGKMEAVKDEFSRTKVALMPMEVVYLLIGRIRLAIVFLLDRVKAGNGERVLLRNLKKTDRVANLIEVLSFLSSRCDSDVAIDLVEFCSEISHRQDFVDSFAVSKLPLLITRVLKAIEPKRRKEACLTLLNLPMACEKNIAIKERMDWTLAFDKFDYEAWRTATRTAEWAGVIARLLNAIKENKCKVSRSDAIYRLYQLHRAGVLTAEEVQKYNEAVWAHLDDDGSPSNTNLYPHVFLRFPGADEHLYEDVFYRTVVKELVQEKFTEKNLIGLNGASFDENGKYKRYILKQEDADQILEKSLAWRPAPQVMSFSVKQEKGKNIALKIARTLALTVLPSSTDFVEGMETASKVLDRIQESGRSELVILAPILAGKNPSVRNQAMDIVRDGLVSLERNVITMSLIAVLWYHDMNRDVPNELIFDTILICLMRREPGLRGALGCVKEFIESGVFPQEERVRLVSALERIWFETQYKNWLDESSSSDVGLLRGTVVQVCEALRNAGDSEDFLDRCIDEAKADPMPEVRYALY